MPSDIETRASLSELTDDQILAIMRAKFERAGVPFPAVLLSPDNAPYLRAVLLAPNYVPPEDTVEYVNDSRARDEARKLAATKPPPATKPKPTRKKYEPKQYAPHGKVTVTLKTTNKHTTKFDRWNHLLDVEWRAYVDMNEENHRQTGRYLDISELVELRSYVIEDHPELAELPSEMTKLIPQQVGRAYVKFVESDGLDEALLDKRVNNSFYLEYARFETERRTPSYSEGLSTTVNQPILRFGRKLDPVEFTATADKTLTHLRYGVLRIKGVHVWLHQDGEWRATISSERMLKTGDIYVTEDTDSFEASLNLLSVIADVFVEERERRQLDERDLSLELSAAEIIAALPRGTWMAELTDQSLAHHMKEVGVSKPKRSWAGIHHVRRYTAFQIFDAVARNPLWD